MSIEKLDMKTINFTDENIAKIAEIFPNVVSEGNNGKVIDFDALKQELSGNIVEGQKERYSLNWPGKRQAQLTANIPTTKTLRPCKEESVNFDTTENLYIEGDNLEVLKILQESYLNKVKMIYIDPPYNTGKDFVYKDNYTKSREKELLESGQIDEEGGRLVVNPDSNGRYHSDWLSMMYPRLKLARNLLKDDGVIFISIDENESTNIKKICDELFGEENFLNEIVLENDSRARPYGSVATTHEYILAYCKSQKFIYETLVNPDKEFKFYDDEGGFDLYELRNRNIAFNIDNRPNLYYSFWVNPNEKDNNNLYEISLEKKENYVEVFPQESQGIKTVWRWGKDKAKNNLNTILFAKEANSDSGFQIVKKYRESTYTLNTVWTDKSIKTDKGTLEVKAIFNNKKYFDFPKPVELLKRLLSVGSNSEDIVLDFFSGSATTAHATMKLNSEDNGNRKFIMVQLPETTDEKSEAYKAGYKTIPEIGKERIRRAGKKIVEENGKTELDIGFRVLKLDSSNMKDIYFTPQETTQDMFDYEDTSKGTVNNIKEDRSDMDLLFGVLIDWGVDLTLPIKKEIIKEKTCYFVDEDSLCACFETNLDEEFFKELAKISKERNLLRVVFRDSGFDSDDVKDNVSQIFKQLSENTSIKVI